MATIQVVLDEALLRATDTVAKREKLNRSVLIRRALEEHLKRLAIRDLEDRDRRGYEATPQKKAEFLPWEDAAAWPD